jgi:hypothetical protein
VIKSARPVQNTARGIRKWLSVRIAFVFSENVMWLPGYAKASRPRPMAAALAASERIFAAKPSEED